MRRVAVLVLQDAIAFDVATPLEVFGRVRTRAGDPAYEVTVAGPDRQVQAGPISLGVPEPLDALLGADLVVVPGRHDPTTPVPDAVVSTLQRAHASGARLASICVGALDLAQTGLLDGRRATTHWSAAGLLAARHPRVRVDPAVLYVDEGDVLTSAGATAGVDLCLHLVRGDHGETVARQAARAAVMPLVRGGGQAQFIDHDVLPPEDATLAPTLTWVEEHSAEPLTVADLARHAHLSVRTLTRRFAAETGMSPAAWLSAVRLRHAQVLLESTAHPVERVARDVGLGTGSNLRARFTAAYGTSPTRYRQAFSASPTT